MQTYEQSQHITRDKKKCVTAFCLCTPLCPLRYCCFCCWLSHITNDWLYIGLAVHTFFFSVGSAHCVNSTFSPTRYNLGSHIGHMWSWKGRWNVMDRFSSHPYIYKVIHVVLSRYMFPIRRARMIVRERFILSKNVILADRF